MINEVIVDPKNMVQGKNEFSQALLVKMPSVS
jgi:hypothetical protein